jgi:uncharacterized membrane protein (UPF0127 family)
MKTLRLTNKSRGIAIANEVREATSFWARAVGLLGQAEMKPNTALWIRESWLSPANSIHTCFMRFAIDVVFVDRNLTVRAVHRNLKPWRMTMPARGASSVFELAAGTLNEYKPIDIGDQLDVGC